MDPPATTTASGQGRRQNPSRSKRGGPGVGTCDVDLMILESYKRKRTPQRVSALPPSHSHPMQYHSGNRAIDPRGHYLRSYYKF